MKIASRKISFAARFKFVCPSNTRIPLVHLKRWLSKLHSEIVGIAYKSPSTLIAIPLTPNIDFGFCRKYLELFLYIKSINLNTGNAADHYKRAKAYLFKTWISAYSMVWSILIRSNRNVLEARNLWNATFACFSSWLNNQWHYRAELRGTESSKISITEWEIGHLFLKWVR